MIRFRFQLAPISEVEPWGLERRLHWFALTDGCYWVDLGDLELLRYAPSTMSRFRAPDSPPYVNYYVVRIWEDVLGLLPEVLKPVPDDLVDFLTSDSDVWVSRDEERADTAVSWYSDHFLDVGYVRRPPEIRWWRRTDDDRDHVTVAWNHPADGDGDIEWDAPRTGQVTVPTSEFVAAVEALDRELMAAMDERITHLERTGPPSGVRLDVPALRAEHQDRTTWLERSRARKPETNWPEIRTGAAILLGHQPLFEPATPVIAQPPYRLPGPASEVLTLPNPTAPFVRSPAASVETRNPEHGLVPNDTLQETETF